MPFFTAFAGLRTGILDRAIGSRHRAEERPVDRLGTSSDRRYFRIDFLVRSIGVSQLYRSMQSD